MYLALKRYSRPDSPAECLQLLAEPDQQVALLSGGTDLNVSGHEHLTHVIDIQALGLDQVDEGGDEVRLGARVTLSQIRRSPVLQHERLTALREAASAYASIPIQNRATVGGRVMVDRSDQDVPTALAALGARLRVVKLSGAGLDASVVDYPIGPDARGALKGSLLTAVLIPLGAGRSALRRMGRTALDVPLACCAAAQQGDRIRLAANVQGPSAADLQRLTNTEKLVGSWTEGRPDDWRQLARQSLLGELAAYEDAWASGDYRQDLSATLAVRALAAVFGEEEIQ